ncbi:hypothetical protein ACO0R3_003832 [Hanseniaspora guilliermondii]
MSDDINNNSEKDQSIHLIVDQPLNSKRPSNINLNNIDENKRDSFVRHFPLVFQNMPTSSDTHHLNSAEFMSPAFPYLQHSNSFSKNIPKKSFSSSVPHNQNYPMQNMNLSGRHSFNTQQQLMLNFLDLNKDNEKFMNPLFSSNSLNHNPSLLTGSSNFSPIDIHNPLVRNSLMIPTYNTVLDNFNNVTQAPSFSPLNFTTNPSFEDDEREFEEFKKSQNEKNNKTLKKTNKKVEKNKKSKQSPNKRKNLIRKSISATGAIKPQLLEINNIAESSIFNTLDYSNDVHRVNHVFPPLSSTEYNKSMFNENPNTVDPNNMFRRKATASVFNTLTPEITSNEYNSLINDDNIGVEKDKEQNNYESADYENYEVDYEDAFMNISQRYSNNYDINDLPAGSMDHQSFAFENDLKNESDMNFINYLALKEKINENANKVTKKQTSKKKKKNVDTDMYLDFENSSKKKDVVSTKKDAQKTVKRGRKPKPIQIKDQKKPSKLPMKRQISTDDNVAPQYINFDNTNDLASKVLTESTKKVIDEIKHNALNGGGNIINFSPLLELPTYQANLNNSGSTLPMSLSSARQFPKSSAHNYNGFVSSCFNGGILNTGDHMMDIKKFSPFDSMTSSSMNSSASTFNNSLKTFGKGVEKISANSDKSSNIKAALKNTMKAIKDSNDKPKLKMINSSALDFFPNNYDHQSKNLDIDLSQVDKMGKKDLASNDSIKAQFLDLKNDNHNKLIENFTILNDDLNVEKKPSTVKIVQRETQRQGFSLKKRLGKVNSNIKQTNEDEKDAAESNALDNDKKEIIQSLEKMFSEKPVKKKPMKKAQYINISTQVMKPTGNLLVKTSVINKPEEPKKLDKAQQDKNTEMARKNLNMAWLKNSNNNIIKLAHKSIVQALKNDPHFTDESLTKNKKGLFSCLHCELKFSNILQYAQHLDEAEVSGPYKCPFVECCWKYFGMKTTQKLRRHCALQHINELTDEMKTILNIKSDSYPEIECMSEYCDKKFIRKDSILRHQQMVHNNPNSRFNNRLNKVQHFIDQHYSQLKDKEKKILVKQYMKGALNLPSSFRVSKKRDKS